MADYYQLLGIDGWVTSEQLRKVYRKRTLIYHPDKNKAPDANYKFKKLVEAYEYLSNEENRKRYDKARNERLGKSSKTSEKNTHKPEASKKCSTQFNDAKPASETFFESFSKNAADSGNPKTGPQFNFSKPASESFFKTGGEKGAANAGDPKGGTSKGFTSQNDNADGKDPFIFTGSGTTGQSTESTSNDQDLGSVIELGVTLEEIAKGVIKDVNISLTVEKDDGTTNMENKILTINVKPGWKAGTKITFPKEINGDTDLVVIIREKPHRHFRRRGNDLLYTAKVTKEQALRGADIDVPSLTGAKLSVYLPPRAINRPSLSKTFKGHGLPSVKDPSAKGDLIVDFQLKSPGL